mmetsp:Transcript_16519/g.39891  ORF Transcript_16519/g.39891 Transcript_16519/m.39891 type:complete len:299 (+) Transcript_16519:691-1587(+)
MIADNEDFRSCLPVSLGDSAAPSSSPATPFLAPMPKAAFTLGGAEPNSSLLSVRITALDRLGRNCSTCAGAAEWPFTAVAAISPMQGRGAARSSALPGNRIPLGVSARECAIGVPRRIAGGDRLRRRVAWCDKSWGKLKSMSRATGDGVLPFRMLRAGVYDKEVTIVVVKAAHSPAVLIEGTAGALDGGLVPEIDSITESMVEGHSDLCPTASIAARNSSSFIFRIFSQKSWNRRARSWASAHKRLKTLPRFWTTRSSPVAATTSLRSDIGTPLALSLSISSATFSSNSSIVPCRAAT